MFSDVFFIRPQNGKLLRSIRSHNAAVVCLNWEEDAQPIGVRYFLLLVILLS